MLEFATVESFYLTTFYSFSKSKASLVIKGTQERDVLWNSLLLLQASAGQSIQKSEEIPYMAKQNVT